MVGFKIVFAAQVVDSEAESVKAGCKHRLEFRGMPGLAKEVLLRWPNNYKLKDLCRCILNAFPQYADTSTP